MPKDDAHQTQPKDAGHLSDDAASILGIGLGQAALESLRTPAGLFALDRRILWINRPMGYIHRCKPQKVQGELCYEVFKCCKYACEDCWMLNVMDSGKAVIFEDWIDLPNGERRWGELHGYPIRDDKGALNAVMVIAFDITDRKRALEAADSSNGQDIEDTEHLLVHLSPRESDVLKFIVEGKTNTQISGELDISNHTVKTHVNSIFNKLGVNDRTLAAVMAVRKNLI